LLGPIDFFKKNIHCSNLDLVLEDRVEGGGEPEGK
jgi:hypothetical protein